MKKIDIDNKYKILMIVIVFAVASCKGQSSKSISDSSKTATSDTSKLNARDGNNHGKRQDTVPDDNSILPRTQAEERESLIKEYGQTKVIDSLFISGKDTLDFHLAYYCLKNDTLTVPKFYDTDKKNPQEFATHPFTSKIILIHNRDTILKKQFKASDFNLFYNDAFGGNLKKFGSISMPHLSRKNKDKSQIMLDYPIGIPTTDIGKGMFLIISKNGDYKIVEPN